MENNSIEKQIPINEKRRFIRHQLCFPLEYKVVGGGVHAKDEGASDEAIAKTPGEVSRSTSINISVGGMLFSAKHPVKIGSSILIKMPFQDKIFHVRAMVAHCEKNKETKLYHIGVTFHRHSAAYKVKLIEQLCLISEFRDLRSIELGRPMSLEKASREWIKRYSARFRKLYW